MITIICTTNRPKSNSLKLSHAYEKTLKEMGEECQILDLRAIPAQWISDSSFADSTTDFDVLVKQYITQPTHLIFITPEYNGGFPGYLKFFIDACDFGSFKSKKVAMMGLASGRSGNLRGLDHLTGILHYLGSEVYSKKVYLSQVEQSLSTDGELTNEFTVNEISAQLEGFINF